MKTFVLFVTLATTWLWLPRPTLAQQSGVIVEMAGKSDESYRKHGGRKADLHVTISFKSGDEPAFQVAVTNITERSLRIATRSDVFAGLLFSNMGTNTELCLVDYKYHHMNFLELAKHEPIPLEPKESITWTIPLERLIILESKGRTRRPVILPDNRLLQPSVDELLGRKITMSFHMLAVLPPNGGYNTQNAPHISPEITVSKQEGEQDGTGQPATRSQSKSEGGDKPQPESEGRSR